MHATLLPRCHSQIGISQQQDALTPKLLNADLAERPHSTLAPGSSAEQQQKKVSSKGTDSLPPGDCGRTGRWPAGPGSFSSSLHSPPALGVERFKILGEPQAALGRRASLGHRPPYPLQGPPNAEPGVSRHAHRLPRRTLVLRLGQSGSTLSSKPDPSAPVHGGSGFLVLSRAEEHPPKPPQPTLCALPWRTRADGRGRPGGRLGSLSL